MKLKPFWRYYGGKWRAAKHYPEPVHGTIIEPFAGAAGYSCNHAELNVILCDLNPKIAGLWQWLISATPEDVLAIPVDINHVDQLEGFPEPVKWLVGFWFSSASTGPRLSRTGWMKQPNNGWCESIRQRIAEQVQLIKHWRVSCQSCYELPRITGTWFIDPPYQCAAGRLYPFNAVDFPALGKWCESLPGQIIVCESAGADWLPFRPCATIQTTHGRKGKDVSHELIWTNDYALAV